MHITRRAALGSLLAAPLLPRPSHAATRSAADGAGPQNVES